MSSATTYTLLGQTDYMTVLRSSYVGDKQPAAAYYLAGKNLQTLTWKTKDFKGILRIQATLVENPTDADWFEAYKIDATQAPLTQTNYYNLYGNFVWLRATINSFTAGSIQRLKVSY